MQQRKDNQQKRIAQGIENGSWTRVERRRLFRRTCLGPLLSYSRKRQVGQASAPARDVPEL